jgi:hypothetical protein
VAAHLRSVPSALAQSPLGGPPPYALSFPSINICYCAAPGLPPAYGLELPTLQKLNSFEREPFQERFGTAGSPILNMNLSAKTGDARRSWLGENENPAVQSRFVGGELKGEMRFDWRAEGLACQIVLTGVR